MSPTRIFREFRSLQSDEDNNKQCCPESNKTGGKQVSQPSKSSRDGVTDRQEWKEKEGERKGRLSDRGEEEDSKFHSATSIFMFMFSKIVLNTWKTYTIISSRSSSHVTTQPTQQPPLQLSLRLDSLQTFPNISCKVPCPQTPNNTQYTLVQEHNINLMTTW